jgi:hypothetical protein
MSEYINTYSFDEIDKGAFTENQISDLFDVNGDGILSEVEKDRAMHIGIQNELNSIHPLVARAYQDEAFLINQGVFLTAEQQMQKNKFRRDMKQIIEQLVEDINNQEEDEVVEYKRDDWDEMNYNVRDNELDTDDLFEDLKRRRYLEDAEINNNP